MLQDRPIFFYQDLMCTDFLQTDTQMRDRKVSFLPVENTHPNHNKFHLIKWIIKSILHAKQ